MKKTDSKPLILGHAERLSAPNFDNYPRNISDSYTVRVVEDIVVDDRIVKQAKYKTVDPADKFKGLKASDFALENIIAVGAVDSLKECKLGYNSIGEISDNLEGTIDNIISAVDAESQTLNNE